MFPSDDAADGEPAARRDTVAIAIAYEPGRDRAPRVVAGGRGAIAEQILQVAFANDVKVREDRDLAELLSAVDIDSGIPVAAFAAVAEILVYVYRANGTLPAATAATSEPGARPT
ncbi:MAG: EscU/YscU/HrcU family type III secretion system export apparatus switch protein [Rhodospirillales bacterium]